MSYRVAAYPSTPPEGENQASISVEWDTLGEAVDSFVAMVESFDGEFSKRQFVIMLKLMLGDYIHNTFQMLSGDEQTVITISKI